MGAVSKTSGLPAQSFRGCSCHHCRGLKRPSVAAGWVLDTDTNRSGTLDVMELQKALALGGLNFSLKTVQAMMRLHDKDGSGNISFEGGRAGQGRVNVPGVMHLQRSARDPLAAAAAATDAGAAFPSNPLPSSPALWPQNLKSCMSGC